MFRCCPRFAPARLSVASRCTPALTPPAPAPDGSDVPYDSRGEREVREVTPPPPLPTPGGQDCSSVSFLVLQFTIVQYNISLIISVSSSHIEIGESWLLGKDRDN